MVIRDQEMCIRDSYNPNTDVEKITKAYNFTKECHEGQFRNSGEPYFIHPVAVANILADLYMDDATIIAGLMHDILEAVSYTHLVPYLGFCREDLTSGELNRAMIIGKGSLFLGRMTNLFDGVSIVLERNSGKVEDNSGVSKEEVKKLVAEAMRNFASSLIEE